MGESVQPDLLKSVIRNAWSRETSADHGHWNERNPAWGQCAVTALVVQDFLGGSLLRIDISKHPNPLISGGGSHYFNEVKLEEGIEELDLSASQFGPGGHDEVRRYADKPGNRTREYLLGNTGTNKRYKILRMRVAEILSGNNPIFKDELYVTCLKKALDSNCQKGKYGCVIMHKGQVAVETCNSIMDVCKDWCEPECIRKSIQSRTESMIGCCAHAEEKALVAIRDLGLRPQDCELYVAGFRSSGLAYIKSEPVHTCLRCTTQMYLHGIGSTYVPCQNRWVKMTAEEAVETAKKFATKERVLENYDNRQ